MQTTIQKIGVGIVVILAILGSIAFFRAPSFGAFQQGQVQNDAWIFTGGLAVGSSQQTSFDGSGLLTIGASGSALTQVISGTCSLISTISINATSTGQVDCAVTGVKSGDKVFSTGFATTSTAIVNQWSIIGAQASTTSGYITFKVLNLTGTNATLGSGASVGLASSTPFLIIR